MKRIMLVAIICGTLGCERHPPTQEENAISASRALIATLATNASVRVIKASERVRENLKDVKGKSKRDALIEDWRNALKSIPVKGLRPSSRYVSVREACHMLNWDLIGAMYEAGTDYETRWNVRFDTVRWLDRQILSMKPEKTTKIISWREENEKWNNYQALVEYYESVIENLEIDEFNEARYPNDVEKMDAIRAKFEKLIGRPVRKREEITRLGFYMKQARARIQKERDAALKKATPRE